MNHCQCTHNWRWQSFL